MRLEITIPSALDGHLFGSQLSIQCSVRQLGSDNHSIFKKRLLTIPEKFGFHPQLNILWLFDKFQLICYQARTEKCLLKLDLRCKSKVLAHQTERSLKFSMINSITNSILVHEFDADEGPIRYTEKEFDFLPEAEHTVLHDSAILYQSEDKCSIEIHDYLRPFLS